MKIKDTEGIVLKVLTENKEARSSDDTLYWAYIVERVGYDIAKGLTMWDVLMNRKALGLSSMDCVGRCRRKVQAKHDELRAEKAVGEYREEREDEYREYANS